MTNTEYVDIKEEVTFRDLIFTGPVDEYFSYCYGKLPYRSMHFEHQTHDCNVCQPAAVINYPNEHEYTRSTELKYITGQDHRKTSVVFEYPRAEGEPYYPIPQPKNAELYQKYKALADKLPDVHFAGRLGTYKYYNMDQVVAQALTIFDRLADRQEASRESVSLDKFPPPIVAVGHSDKVRKDNAAA
jgi:UDP-galactopyranose mutase